MPYEYKVDIAGTVYGMKNIQSLTLDRALFESLSVGNTCCGKLDLTVWPLGKIPRRAKITAYCREISAGDWTQIGVFFISKRKTVSTALHITAIDRMFMAGVEWEPRQELEFPMTMETAAKEIARLMETELDPRCRFNGTYMVDYPANGYTLQDVLRFIAVAHAGNWMVTAEDKLLLVPLYKSMPEETHYLVTERGAPIQIGKVGIYV